MLWTKLVKKNPNRLKDKRKLDKWQRSNGDIIDVNNGVFSELGLEVLDLPKEKNTYYNVCTNWYLYLKSYTKLPNFLPQTLSNQYLIMNYVTEVNVFQYLVLKITLDKKIIKNMLRII